MGARPPWGLHAAAAPHTLTALQALRGSQVLISIQSLIMVDEPFYSERGPLSPGLASAAQHARRATATLWGPRGMP